ncbi:MAG: 2,3-bisphosphoglycerate-independent phosphoglycerate mutase [Nanoarchaeota archaeon]|nr:2,3-bisphosphoglycerate-independent phosphoglycerate mutase [Nanoarchaeota archaeon]
MKKIIYVVLDGAADTPNPEIGGKTAFEEADIPNIDYLARNGKNGIMQVLPIPPESDEAVLSLLGYDVFKVYTGRGPLEAIGGGVDFKDGDLALRCNFATLKDNKIIDVRAGHISDSEASELAKSIQRYVTLTNASYIFKNTAGYRGVLVIKSKEKLSPKISGNHPGYHLQYFDTAWSRWGESKSIPLSFAVKSDMIFRKCVPLEKSKAASFSAQLVNEFVEKSRLILENHPVNLKRIKEGKLPANVILVRDPGTQIPKLYSFRKVYGMNWAAFADMPLERGIAQLCGMDVIPVPPLSNNFEQDLAIRALTLLKNIHLYDAFYIHLKGPDIYAHVGDIKGKVKSIEAIDKYFFKPVLSHIDLENTIVIVTCDHTTSSLERVHTDDPVPVTISGGGVMPDHIGSFCEKECAKGSLGRIHARQLLPYVIKLAKKW